MYKYTEKFVADLLFNENRIRIGTLNGFRDMEAKQGISDPLEGSYGDHVEINGTDEDYHNNAVFRQNVQNFVQMDASSSHITFKNCFVKTTRRSPNYLIFCSAHTKSIQLLKQFDGADTCFHIYKPKTFFDLITWALDKQFQYPVRFLGVHEVSYKPYQRQRSAIDSRPIHPALAKTEEFLPQCELRAIWEIPQELITEPYYDLQVLGLKKYCRLIEL